MSEITMTAEREQELRGAVKFKDSAPGVLCGYHCATVPSRSEFAYLERVYHPAARSCRAARGLVERSRLRGNIHPG